MSATALLSEVCRYFFSVAISCGLSVQSTCLHEVVCFTGFVYVRCMCWVSSGESRATVADTLCAHLLSVSLWRRRGERVVSRDGR